MAGIHGQKDSPTLDLNFAKNKSLIDTMTGRNLVTFSRTQTGNEVTYVGADGLIKYASANEPRFDHDPVTGECLGLLVEEARTNLQYPSIPVINILSTTVTANAAVAPDGTTTATFCEPNGVSTGIRSNASIVKTAEQKYAHTFYFKPNGYNVAGIDYGGGSPDNYAEAWIDVTTNLSYVSLPTNNASGFASIQSTPVGNGWYKIKAIQEIVVGGTTQIWSKTLSCRPDVPTGLGQSYTHTPGSGGYFWGHQEELGTFPTSYIPTEGGTKTRSADVASITGSNFSSWYNTSQSTWYAEGDQLLINANGNQEGVNSLFVDRYADISTQRWRENLWRGMQGSSAIIPPFTTPVTSEGSTVKTVYAIDGVNARMCVDGNLSSIATLGTYPQITELRIGESARLLTTDKWKGHISRLTYWPERLSNKVLQRLTR